MISTETRAMSNVCLLALLFILALAVQGTAAQSKKSFWYKSVNDNLLSLDVYDVDPEFGVAGEARALLYYIHGGGWEFGDKDGVPKYIFEVARRGGYRVASVQYRLTSEADKWGGVSRVTWPAQRDDVVDGLRFLVKYADNPNITIDTSRMACWGGSAGGQLCSMLAAYTTYNVSAGLKLKAAVPFYGPTDIIDMVLDIDPKVGCHIDHDAVDSFESKLLGSNSTHISIKQIREHRDMNDTSDPWGYLIALGESVNPVTYVQSYTTPMFVAHGTNDHTVPFKQSLRLVAALKRSLVPVVLGVAQGCDHASEPAACWAPTVSKAQSWLLKNL